MSEKLRAFLAANNSSMTTPLSPERSPEPKEDYDTIVRKLDSISWQLKRIADALESK